VSTVGRVAEDGGGRPLRDPVAVGSAPYAAFRRPRSRDHGGFPRGDKLPCLTPPQLSTGTQCSSSPIPGCNLLRARREDEHCVPVKLDTSIWRSTRLGLS